MVRQQSSADHEEGQTERDDLLRDFFLGFVKIHVLQHASRAPVYGLALIDELGRHGYRLGPGSLYPLLHGLEQAGFLAREDQIVSGRIRKYYVSTEAGERALDEARLKVRELVDEVLDSDDGGGAGDPDIHG
jgi:DNA-binding PadR family transcriptional regulator